MKIDSGSHPMLYKIGVSLAKKDPRLFDIGVKAITLPEAVPGKIKFALSNKELYKHDELERDEDGKKRKAYWVPFAIVKREKSRVYPKGVYSMISKHA
ncbi:MAG: hypothetical protein ACP5MX_02520 [Candidatus Micrarchaeia archaeon]